MAAQNLIWHEFHFVQGILRNSEKDESIEVRGLTVSKPTAEGDHFGSDMHRIAVEFTQFQDGDESLKRKSFIVKVARTTDSPEKMMKTAIQFGTELPMLSITLPKMNEFLEKLNFASLSPLCYYVQYDEPFYAVIEDLTPRGFLMADCRVGLDLDHCLLVIRNLGRFHATSIALKEKDPKALTKYRMGFFHKDQPHTMRHLVNWHAKAFAEEVARWSEVTPRIITKIHKLSEDLYEKTCLAMLCEEHDFHVLNHGDFWVNNMLFRYDEQRKPIDNIFVDFQRCHYGSPAEDILYFFGTSPTDAVRLHHREVILREYHTSLTSTMSKLKCKTNLLGFDELQEILKKRGLREVVASVTVLPNIMYQKDAERNSEENVKPEKKNEISVYRGKPYRQIMTRLLPWYDTMGLLDEMTTKS